MRICSVVFLLFAATRAFAYPEMVRHGYVNCLACHTTQTGGGLLNEYGRQLSKELLSQTSLGGVPVSDGEEQFLYGFAKPRSPWLVGGDLRLLQLLEDTKEASRGRFVIMQMDIDASYQADEHWRLFASVGRFRPGQANPKAKDFVGSPRFGAEYLFTKTDAPNRLTVRAGRFMPAYGIAFAEHTFVTRDALNFGPGQERYATEVAWNDDTRSVTGTVLFAQAEGNNNRVEKGAILQATTAVREKSKLGVNYYQSQRESATKQRYTRRAYGFFSHIGFSKDWYGLLEANRIEDENGNWGLAEVFKLGYEVHQGWHLIAVQEYYNRNLNEANPKTEAFSIGTQWFPRPHWDLYALYRKQRDTARDSEFGDAVWLVGHFYL